VLLGLLCGTAVYANPDGATVVNGQVNFAQPDLNTLNITNSNGAIINWQQFSINHNEITRFIQDSTNSAVLNRVIGNGISIPLSVIQGSLLSNGRVFLLNSSGILIGPNAVIDTAGFIASTLNMTDEDFINENLKFQGTNAADISNKGYIKAGANGDIFLIAPNIENSGIIETDGGQIILAAGESITIASLDSDHIVFDVQAPENEVVNLGEVITNGGAASMFAGTIKHSGSINADSLSVDEHGNVQLFAKADIDIATDAIITANGAEGGEVKIESDTGTVWNSGTIEAKGDVGKGGHIEVLGERVALLDKAQVDVSGETGGGEVLIGGDYQGKNPDVQNATVTYVGEDTSIKADAVTNGDGGKVIVWANETAQIHGDISAKGGSESGNGGFVETSAKENLQITRTPDVTAPNGQGGEWLIDPNNIDIVAGSGFTNINNSDPFVSTADGAQLGVDLIEAALSGGVSVSVTTAAGGAELGNINLNTILELDDTGGPATNTLTLNAHNDININSAIVDTIPGGQTLNLTLIADSDSSSGGVININADIDTGGGLIDATSGSGDVRFSGTRIIDSNFNATTLTIDSTDNISFNGTTSTSTLIHSAGTLGGSGTVTASTTWTPTSGVTVDGNLILGSGILKTFTGFTLNGSGTVTMPGTLTLSSGTNTFNPTFTSLGALNLSGGSLLGNGNITVSGLTNWTGGSSSIGGTGKLTTNGAFDITVINDTKSFNRDVDMFGGGTWIGRGILALIGTGTVTNKSGSLLTTIPDCNCTVFRTFMPFNNDGTVERPTGVGSFSFFTYEGGGSHTGSFIFNRNNTAFVGTHNFSSTSSITGSAQVQYNGNMTFDNGATYNLGGTLLIGGTMTMDTTGSTGFLTHNAGTLDGSGSLTVNNTWTPTSGVTVDGNLILGSGISKTFTGFTLNGSGTVTMPGTLTLSSGTNTFNPTFTSLGALNLSGGSLLGNGNITVSGLTNWTGGSSSIGGTGKLTTNGAFDITVSGTKSINRDVDMFGGGTWNGAGVINGSGTVTNKLGSLLTTTTTSTSTSFITQMPFNNDGTVERPTGIGTFAFVTYDGGGSHTGSFIFNRNNTAFGGTHNFSSTSSITGTHEVNYNGNITFDSGATYNLGGTLLNGGTLTMNTTGSTGFLTHSAGTLGGTTGSLTVNNTWTPATGVTVNINNLILASGVSETLSGTLNGSGSITNNGTLALNNVNFSPDLVNTTNVLTFTGTNTINSGSDFSGAGDVAFTGGTTTFSSGSSYTMSGDTGINGGDVNFNIAAVTNTLTHAVNTLGGSGSLTTTGWTPTSGVTINNLSLILGVGYSGTLSGITINNVGTASITNQGSLTLNGSTIGTNFTNQGSMSITGGISNLSGTATQTAGTLTVNAGATLTTATLNINGGTLNGTGTISGAVINNGGILAAGTSPGTLTITGNYTQGAGGTFLAELAGATTAGTDYDLLSVGGTTSLAGTLDIQLFGGFTGSVGDQFDIIQSTGLVSGDFTTVNVPSTHTFSNTPLANSYQIEITSTGTTTTTIDATDQVIVLNDYQDELGDDDFTSGGTGSIYPLREEDEEEEKELACR